MHKNHASHSLSTPQCEILLLHVIFKLPFIRPKCKNEILSTYKTPKQHVQDRLAKSHDQK